MLADLWSRGLRPLLKVKAISDTVEHLVTMPLTRLSRAKLVLCARLCFEHTMTLDNALDMEGTKDLHTPNIDNIDIC